MLKERFEVFEIAPFDYERTSGAVSETVLPYGS